MYSPVFTFNLYVLCCLDFTENLYYKKPYLEMHFPCKENQLFSGIHALNAFWRNSENVGTSASRCPTSDSSTPPQTSWGKLFFFPLHLWDTLTENIKMQSCLFSFCHYGEVSSIPSVFLKLKPVFFQRQRNCTELSRCLKTPAEIYWFKNLTLKKKGVSCFGGWKMPFNCKWTIQQSRFLSMC